MQNILKKYSSFLPKSKKVYIVGGSLRDILLEKEPEDIDIAVLGDAEAYASELADKMKGKLIILGKKEFKTYKVITKKNSFDLTSAHENSIEANLKKRDFTINSLALNLWENKIIDIFDAISDIKNKKIKMASDNIFEKDPLRLLRAYRISLQTGFTIEKETAERIKKDSELIAKSAAERITSELFKIFDNKKSARCVKDMSESGLLFSIFPELKALKGCMQNKYHDFDAFFHTVNTLEKLEQILNPYSCRHYEEFLFLNKIKILSSNLEKKRISALKLAILLHDIGKPLTKSINDKNEICFYNHEKKGADIAERICKKLKMSSDNVEYINFIINNHIKALFLFENHLKGTLTEKIKFKFFLKLKEKIPDVLLHTVSDILGKKERYEKRELEFSKFILNIYNDYAEKFKKIKALPKLLTGNDLINELKLYPSPIFKEILNSVEEARIIGIIKNKTEAIYFAKEIMNCRRLQNSEVSDK